MIKCIPLVLAMMALSGLAKPQGPGGDLCGPGTQCVAKSECACSIDDQIIITTGFKFGFDECLDRLPDVCGLGDEVSGGHVDEGAELHALSQVCCPVGAIAAAPPPSPPPARATEASCGVRRVPGGGGLRIAGDSTAFSEWPSMCFLYKVIVLMIFNSKSIKNTTTAELD